MAPLGPAVFETACAAEGSAGNFSLLCCAARVRPGTLPTFLFAAASATRSHTALLVCFADLGMNVRACLAAVKRLPLCVATGAVGTSDGNASTIEVAVLEYSSQESRRARRFSSESKRSAVSVTIRPVTSSWFSSSECIVPMTSLADDSDVRYERIAALYASTLVELPLTASLKRDSSEEWRLCEGKRSEAIYYVAWTRGRLTMP